MGWKVVWGWSKFFTMNPNLKYFLVGRGRGVGARVSKLFSKNPNLFFFFLGGGGGGLEGARLSIFF